MGHGYPSDSDSLSIVGGPRKKAHGRSELPSAWGAKKLPGIWEWGLIRNLAAEHKEDHSGIPKMPRLIPGRMCYPSAECCHPAPLSLGIYTDTITWPRIQALRDTLTASGLPSALSYPTTCLGPQTVCVLSIPSQAPARHTVSACTGWRPAAFNLS